MNVWKALPNPKSKPHWVSIYKNIFHLQVAYSLIVRKNLFLNDKRPTDSHIANFFLFKLVVLRLFYYKNIKYFSHGKLATPPTTELTAGLWRDFKRKNEEWYHRNVDSTPGIQIEESRNVKNKPEFEAVWIINSV